MGENQVNLFVTVQTPVQIIVALWCLLHTTNYIHEFLNQYQIGWPRHLHMAWRNSFEKLRSRQGFPVRLRLCSQWRFASHAGPCEPSNETLVSREGLGAMGFTTHSYFSRPEPSSCVRVLPTNKGKPWSSALGTLDTPTNVPKLTCFFLVTSLNPGPRRWRQWVSPKCWWHFVGLYGVTSSFILM